MKIKENIIAAWGKIKLPNRDALFLRNSPYMAFLDGQGTTEMEEQQERKQKQE